MAEEKSGSEGPGKWSRFGLGLLGIHVYRRYVPPGNPKPFGVVKIVAISIVLLLAAFVALIEYDKTTRVPKESCFVKRGNQVVQKKTPGCT